MKRKTRGRIDAYDPRIGKRARCNNIMYVDRSERKQQFFRLWWCVQEEYPYCMCVSLKKWKKIKLEAPRGRSGLRYTYGISSVNARGGAQENENKTSATGAREDQ